MDMCTNRFVVSELAPRCVKTFDWDVRCGTWWHKHMSVCSCRAIGGYADGESAGGEVTLKVMNSDSKRSAASYRLPWLVSLMTHVCTKTNR